MTKRIVFGIVVVFVSWQILDFVIHNVILSATYAATADLWRPMEEMKMGLIAFVALIASVTFVLIWCCLIKGDSVCSGALYGLLYGISVGSGMGFGTYAVIPIPGSLAWAWFIGTVVEAIVAGVLVALIVRAPSESVSG